MPEVPLYGRSRRTSIAPAAPRVRLAQHYISEMELVEALSNLEIQDRLRRLSEKFEPSCLTGTVFVGSLSCCDGDGWLSFHSVEFLDFAWWTVVEAFVDALVVEPRDVLQDGELELAAAGPGSVCDELGLEGVDEALSDGVVVG